MFKRLSREALCVVNFRTLSLSVAAYIWLTFSVRCEGTAQPTSALTLMRASLADGF